MRLLKSLMAASLAILMTLPGMATAAPAPGGYNWSGSYAGAVASGGLFTVEQEDYWCWWACNAPTLQDWDASIGLQAGHNWQNGNFVHGLVVDWSTGFENSESVRWNSNTTGVDWSAEWNSYATIRGRAGLAAGNALVFATAGVAIVDVDYSASEFQPSDNCSDTDVDCAAYSDTEYGFAGGIGVGYPVGDNMHLTFEYLYIGLPWAKDRYDSDEEDNPTETDDYVSWTTSAHIGRVALVWEFDGL